MLVDSPSPEAIISQNGSEPTENYVASKRGTDKSNNDAQIQDLLAGRVSLSLKGAFVSRFMAVFEKAWSSPSRFLRFSLPKIAPTLPSKQLVCGS